MLERRADREKEKEETYLHPTAGSDDLCINQSCRYAMSSKLRPTKQNVRPRVSSRLPHHTPCPLLTPLARRRRKRKRARSRTSAPGRNRQAAPKPATGSARPPTARCRTCRSGPGTRRASGTRASGRSGGPRSQSLSRSAAHSKIGIEDSFVLVLAFEIIEKRQVSSI